MVLELEVEAPGFALHVHLDRPVVEVLAGVMGAYDAGILAEGGALDRLHARGSIDGIPIVGSTPSEFLAEAIRRICAEVGPEDNVADIIHERLHAHGFELPRQGYAS